MDKVYYLGFSAFPGIGPAKFQKLLERFGKAEAAWNAGEKELQQIIGDTLTSQFLVFRKKFSLEKFVRHLEEKCIHFVTSDSEKYPSLLKEIHNAPFVVYIKGEVSLLSSARIVGVVGTRKVTDYGREVTQQLTGELVNEGFVIVSGLALGVDGIAHKTALDANGQTIAVLGSGVDFCTPREHQRLYDAILEKGGAIISSFLPGEAAGIGSFPARNRIVAGLSQGIVVTEGAEDSGSLITANFAKELGRPVFAVPGPITSALSKGANNLLAQGAIVTTSSKAILDRLGIMKNQKALSFAHQEVRGETSDEQGILDLLKTNPLHFDDIVRKMDKDSKAVGSLLSLMELKGLIKSNSEGKYSIIYG